MVTRKHIVFACLPVMAIIATAYHQIDKYVVAQENARQIATDLPKLANLASTIAAATATRLPHFSGSFADRTSMVNSQNAIEKAARMLASLDPKSADFAAEFKDARSIFFYGYNGMNSIDNVAITNYSNAADQNNSVCQFEAARALEEEAVLARGTDLARQQASVAATIYTEVAGKAKQMKDYYDVRVKGNYGADSFAATQKRDVVALLETEALRRKDELEYLLEDQPLVGTSVATDTQTANRIALIEHNCAYRAAKEIAATAAEAVQQDNYYRATGLYTNAQQRIEDFVTVGAPVSDEDGVYEPAKAAYESMTAARSEALKHSIDDTVNEAATLFDAISPASE